MRRSKRSRGLVGASVRVLEGALIRVVAYASLNEQGADPRARQEVLGRLYRRPRRGPCSVRAHPGGDRRPSSASRATALLARDRTPQVAFARQVAMYLARELTDQGLPALGREFGGRNHTTVLHAWKRVSELVDKPGEKRETVDSIRRRLEHRGLLTTVAADRINSLRSLRRQPGRRSWSEIRCVVHNCTLPTSSRQDR